MRQHVTWYGVQMGRRCCSQRYSGVHFSGNVSYGRACAVLQSAKLTRELEHYKAESMRLDSENERLEKVRSRVLGEHRSHQDDTQYLETQMAALKRENLKLKREVEYEAGESMRVFLMVCL